MQASGASRSRRAGWVLMYAMIAVASGRVWAQDPPDAPDASVDGGRTWLKQRGIVVESRLTQFYQGLAAGEGGRD